jgi:hypothetical protein
LYRDNGDGLRCSDIYVEHNYRHRDGRYAFNNLDAGTYYVEEVVPTGFVRTYPLYSFITP